MADLTLTFTQASINTFNGPFTNTGQLFSFSSAASWNETLASDNRYYLNQDPSGFIYCQPLAEFHYVMRGANPFEGETIRSVEITPDESSPFMFTGQNETFIVAIYDDNESNDTKIYFNNFTNWRKISSHFHALYAKGIDKKFEGLKVEWSNPVRGFKIVIAKIYGLKSEQNIDDIYPGFFSNAKTFNNVGVYDGDAYQTVVPATQNSFGLFKFNLNGFDKNKPVLAFGTYSNTGGIRDYISGLYLKYKGRIGLNQEFWFVEDINSNHYRFYDEVYERDYFLVREYGEQTGYIKYPTFTISDSDMLNINDIIGGPFSDVDKAYENFSLNSIYNDPYQQLPSPTFVGAGPAAYDGTVAWPDSIAISDSTPVNIKDGDRVLCVVTTYADANINDVVVPTPTNWTLVDSQVSNPSYQHLGVWLFSARWGDETKNQLVQPTSSNADGRSWRLQCMAWRPSKPFNETSIGYAVGTFDLNIPPIGNSYGANSGSTPVLVQVTRNGGFTGSLSGFYGNLTPTLRVDQAAIAGRGGALRMADASTTGNFSSGSGSWARDYSGSTVSIGFLGIIEAVEYDPSPKVYSKWQRDAFLRRDRILTVSGVDSQIDNTPEPVIYNYEIFNSTSSGEILPPYPGGNFTFNIGTYNRYGLHNVSFIGEKNLPYSKPLENLVKFNNEERNITQPFVKFLPPRWWEDLGYDSGNPQNIYSPWPFIEQTRQRGYIYDGHGRGDGYGGLENERPSGTYGPDQPGDKDTVPYVYLWKLPGHVNMNVTFIQLDLRKVQGWSIGSVRL